MSAVIGTTAPVGVYKSPPVVPGTQLQLEADVDRLLDEVPGFKEQHWVEMFGGAPGAAVFVEPIVLPDLGHCGKTALPVTFFLCIPPRYAFRFQRKINPGLIVGQKPELHLVKLRGMCSRVIEGSLFLGLSGVWERFFQEPLPPWGWFRLRNWEVLLNSKGRISKVNVGGYFEFPP